MVAFHWLITVMLLFTAKVLQPDGSLGRRKVHWRPVCRESRATCAAYSVLNPRRTKIARAVSVCKNAINARACGVSFARTTANGYEMRSCVYFREHAGYCDAGTCGRIGGIDDAGRSLTA